MTLYLDLILMDVLTATKSEIHQIWSTAIMLSHTLKKKKNQTGTLSVCRIT